ncbi:MAG: hypothetical protein U0559_15330 [Anaerolineae bacterium]
MQKMRATLYSLVISSMLLAACASTSITTPTTTSVSTVPTAATSPVATETATNPASTVNNAPPAPPSGNPPAGAPAGGGATSAADALSTATGAYSLNGGSATETDKTYTASNADQSSVFVINGGTLNLVNPIVTKTGDTSSGDNSSFYGLNAAVLATSGSQITIEGGTVDANGAGANGIFATGSSTVVTVSNMTINAYGDGAHAVMATNTGTLILNNVTMNTTDVHSGAIATDRGSGTITANGGTVTTSGADSPAIYSTGVIKVTDATLTATGAEAAVIEGANSIELTNSTLTSSVADKWGVMIYQSFSGDAEGSDGIFTMTGGSLAYMAANGPLFYVTNSTGIVTLKGVAVTAASSVLARAEGNDRWGNSGANGGTLILAADGQVLSGDVSADKISSIALTLQNGSALTAAVNSDNAAKTASLTLDASSTWTVTADSYLSCLSDEGGISGTTITNINGKGHTVYYNPSACAALNGQTYTLNGGGTLKPIS